MGGAALHVSSLLPRPRGPRPPSSTLPPDSLARPVSPLSSGASGGGPALASPVSMSGLSAPRSPRQEKEPGKGGLLSKVGRQISKKHACERAFVCALAVAFLWATSLGAVKAIVLGLIPSPAVDQVIASDKDLVAGTEAGKAEYEACAVSVASACRANYQEDIARELARLAQAEALLEQYINQTAALDGQCADAYVGAVGTITYLINTGSFSLSQHTRSVPGLDCTSELSGILSTQVKKADAVSTVSGFKGAADAQNAQLASQLDARAAYDAAFMNNATGGYLEPQLAALQAGLADPAALRATMTANLSQAMACLSAQGVYQGAVCQGNNPMYRASVSFNTAMERYNEVQADAAAYRAEVLAKYTRYQELYFKIKSIYDAMSAAQLAGLTGFSLPALASLDDLLGGFLNADLSKRFMTPAQLQAELQARALQQQQAIEASAREMAAANADFDAVALAARGAGFNDYNPPPVDEDPAGYEEASATVMTKMGKDLDATTGNNGNPYLNNVVQAHNANVSQVKASLLTKAEPRSWDYYLYDASLFRNMELGYSTLVSVALYLDYAYRVLQSLQLIRKYWNISAVSTPPADVRSKEGVAKGTFKAQANPAEAAAKAITHPALNLCLVLAFLVLFSLAFYAAYKPLYAQYTANCVELCWNNLPNSIVDAQGQPMYEAKGNGTMLYRNAYAVASQFAYEGGDYVAATQVDALNAERGVTCQDNTTQSLRVALNQNDAFDFYNQNYAMANAQIGVLNRCFNYDTAKATPAYAAAPNKFMPALTNGSLCDEKPLASLDARIAAANRDPARMLADGKTPDPGKELRRLFSCDRVRPCKFACSGPNEPKLRSQTFASACNTEWFFHAATLSFFMVSLVYVVINFSRYVLFRGIVKVWWRHLVTTRFTFIASCSEDGRVIYPQDVQDTAMSFQAAILRELHIALRSFEREGLLELLLAVAINVPWIAVLVVLNRTLAFDAGKLC
jgi:hypothetical protein